MEELLKGPEIVVGGAVKDIENEGSLRAETLRLTIVKFWTGLIGLIRKDGRPLRYGSQKSKNGLRLIDLGRNKRIGPGRSKTGCGHAGVARGRLRCISKVQEHRVKEPHCC